MILFLLINSSEVCTVVFLRGLSHLVGYLVGTTTELTPSTRNVFLGDHVLVTVQRVISISVFKPTVWIRHPIKTCMYPKVSFRCLGSKLQTPNESLLESSA